MALATHQLQGSYKLYPLRPASWSSESKLKHFVKLHVLERKEKFVSLKCKSCLSVGAPVVLRQRGKHLKISAFKGNGQNSDHGSRANGSNSLKKSAKLSYASDESEGTLLEPPKAKSIPVSYSSSDETSTNSRSIHNLFKYWLSLMRTPPPNQVVEEPFEKQPASEISEQNLPQRKDRSEISKGVLRYFMSLDATLVIPLLIFVPCYVTVNFVYGAEVSKELTPLWVLGPLIVALYIKMLRGIFALYVFTFKQTVKVIKNLPTYYLLAYKYIARGQLKEDIHARLVQPVVDIKNLDYKEFSRRKLKDFQTILVEKYLDFVESIWPYYCRTIRFLKRANLI